MFARVRPSAKASTITCHTPDGIHIRPQCSFRENPNAILNFSATAEDAEVISHMLEVPHTTLADRASWALGIVTGNNKKFVVSTPRPGYVEVYRGADITKTTLKDPTCFIPGDLALYQQVAPRHLYEAPEKLLYKFISSELIMYHDTDQKFVLNSANLMIVDDDFPVGMSDLAQYFNSELINWFYKTVFGTHKVLRSDLETIPIYADYLTEMSRFSEHELLSHLGVEKTNNGTYRLKK